jgi:8-oxo-dGTP diphosphatase
VFHLIRHAHAGTRSEWVGDDTVRPLSAKGRAQAACIATSLAPSAIQEIWTSPFRRCRQTVEPLAAALQLPVTDHALLAEGADAASTLDELVAASAAGRIVAACSHGDVVPAVLAEAVRRGAELDGSAEPRKGARYEATVEGGRVVRLVHVPRPEV